MTPEDRALRVFGHELCAIAPNAIDKSGVSGDEVRRRIAAEIREAIESAAKAMSIFYLVWGALPTGEKTVLIALPTREAADKHAERITKQPLSEDGRDVCLSHAQVLGIEAVWVSEMLVAKS